MVEHDEVRPIALTAGVDQGWILDMLDWIDVLRGLGEAAKFVGTGAVGGIVTLALQRWRERVKWQEASHAGLAKLRQDALLGMLSAASKAHRRNFDLLGEGERLQFNRSEATSSNFDRASKQADEARGELLDADMRHYFLLPKELRQVVRRSAMEMAFAKTHEDGWKAAEALSAALDDYLPPMPRWS